MQIPKISSWLGYEVLSPLSSAFVSGAPLLLVPLSLLLFRFLQTEKAARICFFFFFFLLSSVLSSPADDDAADADGDLGGVGLELSRVKGFEPFARLNR